MIKITAQRNKKPLAPYTTSKKVHAHAKLGALLKDKNVNSIILTISDRYGLRCINF